MTSTPLHHNDLNLRRILELSSQGAFQADLKGNCSFVNREMELIYGVSDGLGMNWINGIYEDDLPLIKAILNRSEENSTSSYTFQYRVLHPKKGLRDCRVKAKMTTDSNGKQNGIIGFIEDCTEELQKIDYNKIKSNLVAALDRIHIEFHNSNEPSHLFNDLLAEIIKITDSEFGFMTEILSTETDKKDVRKLATYGFDVLERNSENKKDKEEFTDLYSFYEKINSREVDYLISNNIKPNGTQKVKSWLILPAWIGNDLLGIIGLANRPDGYQANMDFITPFLRTYTNLIDLYRLKKARFDAEKKKWDLTDHLQTLITSLDDIVFELDGNKVYRQAWVRDERNLFMPPSEFIGRTVLEVLGELGVVLSNLIQKVLTTGETEEFEYPHIDPASEKWYKARLTLIHKDSDPALCRIAMSVQDITVRTKQTKEIKDANERLEHLNYVLDVTQELGKVAGWEFRFNSDMMFYTKQVYKIYEIDEDFVTSILGMRIFFDPEDMKRMEIASEKAIREGGSFQLEMGMTTGRNNKKWVKIIGQALIVDDQVVGLRGATLDITEEKASKEKLENVNLLLDMTQELGKVTGWEMTTGEDRIAVTNEAYKLYEVADDFVLTMQNLAQFYSEKDLQTLNNLANKAVEEKGSYKLELSLTTAKGNKKWVRIIATPLPDDSGGIKGIRGATIDISEEKESHDLLERSNFLLDVTQDLGKVSGWELYFNSDRMFFTKQSYELYELDDDFIATTTNMSQFHTVEDDLYMKDLAAKAVSEKSFYKVEIELITAKKNRKWVRIIGIPLIVDNEVIGLRGATIDITEEKEAKNKLERLNSLMDITQELGKVGGWEYLMDGKDKMFFTKQSYDIYEFDLDHDTSLPTLRKHYDEKDMILMDSLAKKALEERSSYKIELAMTTAKKNKKWIRTIAIPYIIDDQVLGLRGANIDITEEKEAKTRLERLNFLLDVTQELGKVAGWEYSFDSDKITLTRQAKLLYELEDDQDLTAENMSLFFKPEDRELMSRLSAEAATRRGSYKAEMELHTAKKNKKWVRIIGIPLIVNNNVVGLRGATIDITEEKEAELALLKVKEKLEVSNKDKDRILQVLAHDMRSPLSSIHTMSGLVLDDERISEKSKEMLQLIHDSSASSYEMVGELIDALASYNAETLRRTVNDLSALIKRCVRIQTFRADEKSQTIRFKSSQPVSVFIDAAKTERVVNNLINNAIKFSPENSLITIGIQLKNNRVRVSVTDQGIGVPEDLQDKIFDIFTRGKRYGTSGERPFGLGLSICKQIVTAHGGQIGLESTPGKGSIFFFELPLEAQPKE